MNDDIINMKYPNDEIEADFPDKINRAAQFSPFAALTGYEDAVRETARLTTDRIELDDDAKDILELKFLYLKENLDKKAEVQITYYLPDDKKEGGKYVRYDGVVKKIDDYKRIIIMEAGVKILIRDVVSIESDAFDSFDFIDN